MRVRKIWSSDMASPSPIPLPAWFHPPPLTEPQKLGVIEDDMNYGERLFHYTYGTRHEDVHYLEYRMLHRLNIFHLQNRLAELKGSCWTNHDLTDADLLDLKNKLHDYSKCPSRLWSTCGLNPMYRNGGSGTRVLAPSMRNISCLSPPYFRFPISGKPIRSESSGTHV